MNRFEIISQEQFNKDFEQFPQTSYNDLKKPARATMGSAGYDLYAPFDITLAPGETIKIPACKQPKFTAGKGLKDALN